MLGVRAFGVSCLGDLAFSGVGASGFDVFTLESKEEVGLTHGPSPHTSPVPSVHVSDHTLWGAI